ncbi:MAG: hypothetical protein KGD65_13395 [Candidatus Lokiarchaeota archaeon]|nr:hypothetical protein [Candidatus Lokiarchaeota archaeon]
MQMNKKLFRGTYKFVCSKCGVFSHTIHEDCEKCGAISTIHSAGRQDYR